MLSIIYDRKVGWVSPLFRVLSLLLEKLLKKSSQCIHIKGLQDIYQRIRLKNLGHQYLYSFSKLNLQEAYKYRLNHFKLALENNANEERLLNYLAIIKSEEISDMLELDLDYFTNLKIVQREDELIKYFSYKNYLYSTNKLCIIGPKANINDINFDAYDSVAILKPIVSSNLRNKNIFCFFNHQASKFNIDEFLRYYKGIIIFSPSVIHNQNTHCEVFKEIPSGPHGSSPMGLARALFLVNRYIETSQVEIIGFDLGLSKNNYHEEYPTLAKLAGNNQSDELLIISNAIHDYLFNIMFLRKLFIYGDTNFKGKILNIVNLPLKELFKKFRKRYNEKSKHVR